MVRSEKRRRCEGTQASRGRWIKEEKKKKGWYFPSSGMVFLVVSFNPTFGPFGHRFVTLLRTTPYSVTAEQTCSTTNCFPLETAVRLPALVRH